MSSKPLAKALHTVTVVARLAAHQHAQNKHRHSGEGIGPRVRTLQALLILGYSIKQAEANPELLDKCIAATRKAMAEVDAAPPAPRGWTVVDTSVEDDAAVTA